MPPDSRYDPTADKHSLLDDAAEATEELMGRMSRQQKADTILDKCETDHGLGVGSPLLSRAEVDAIFGHGRWRGIPRFVIEQGLTADGEVKQRCIDDGQQGSHNAHSSALERLVLPSSAFPGVAAALFCLISDLLGIDVVAEGQYLESGKDDWPGAFGHMPTEPDEHRYYVVSFK